MEPEYINVNLIALFVEKRTLLTQRGWIRTKDLQDEDQIFAVSGDSSWKEMHKRLTEKKLQVNNYFG